MYYSCDNNGTWCDRTISMIADTPDAPKDLEIETYDKMTCNLKWKKPDHDGGNPIQGSPFAS